MDLVLQTKQSKNQIHPLIRVCHVQSERFSAELIVKISDTWTVNYRRNEAMSLALIRELTNIPVPRVLQVSQAGDESGGTGTVFLATEYIPGRTLDKCWHSLGFFAKARIVWTLRNYVTQLRRMKRTTPGPLDRSQVFEGYYFSHQGAGPFETCEDMIHWFNRRIEIGNKRAAQKCDVSSFTASGPLVFCHQDLCLRNILLGDDGVLYVLDWEWAGFYPEWLELAGMTRYSDQPWSFRIFIPFICGTSSTHRLATNLIDPHARRRVWSYRKLETISRRCLGNTCRVFVTITGPLPTLSSCSSLILSKFTLCQFSSCNSTEAAFQGKNTVLCCEDDDCAPRNSWPSLRTLNTYTESKPPWTDQRLDICDACPSTCSPTARDFYGMFSSRC